jgi:hypothetical protein
VHNSFNPLVSWEATLPLQLVQMYNHLNTHVYLVKILEYVFNVCFVQHMSVHVGLERFALSFLGKARMQQY